MPGEVEGGIAAIANKLGIRADHFAYPYGYKAAVGAREFEIVRSLSCKTAVTTRPGMLFADHRNHLTALPRISVNGLYQKLNYFGALTTGLPTRLKSGMRRLDVS